MSLPVSVWVERPWPRRSWAMTRKPFAQEEHHLGVPVVALSGQPWWNTIGWAVPQSL
jgi:hypothetical protein